MTYGMPSTLHLILSSIIMSTSTSSMKLTTNHPSHGTRFPKKNLQELLPTATTPPCQNWTSCHGATSKPYSKTMDV